MLRGSVSPACSHPHGSVFSKSQGDVVIDQADVPVGTQHDIGRLDIPMEDPVGRTAVQVFQRFQKLGRPLDHLRLRRVLPPVQEFIQALPLDKIHDRVDHAVLLYKIVYLGDVGMA